MALVVFCAPLQGAMIRVIDYQWPRFACHWLRSVTPAARLSFLTRTSHYSGGMRMKIFGLILVAILPHSLLAQTPKPTVNDLSFLAGCWELNANGREINEHWMKPSGGVMLGMGRTVVNGNVREYEFTQIRQEKDGEIFYVAKPSGQEEGSFKLVKLQNKEAVFENLEHDFPQRVIYRLQADGSLFARVEGTLKGQMRGIDFPYKRAKCDSN